MMPFNPKHLVDQTTKNRVENTEQFTTLGLQSEKVVDKLSVKFSQDHHLMEVSAL